MSDHGFTPEIRAILAEEFGATAGASLLETSTLLQYINRKTRSASRDSKARGSFANLYAIYVLVEDYVARGFADGGDYEAFEGTQFSALFARQRELPFGEKLQNHALNSRLNEEFRGFFPAEGRAPIIRDLTTSRYKFDHHLLAADVAGLGTVDIARAVLRIIDAYVAAKQGAFEEFLEAARRIVDDAITDEERLAYVSSLLAPTSDARVFEIVSFAILKAHFGRREVWLGPTRDEVTRHPLELFKTGRTNANDGGIDFVLRPIGRFFQVTETLDFRKYFLDLEKVKRFPLTFVVKTERSVDDLTRSLADSAHQTFPPDVARAYLDGVEELVNLPALRDYCAESLGAGDFSSIVGEIALQARLEFNLG